MKHLPPELLAAAADRAAAPAFSTPELLTCEQVKADMRVLLDGSDLALWRLAERLEISESQLRWLLRSERVIGPEVAKRFGYRRVIRFERVCEDESRGAAFEARK